MTLIIPFIVAFIAAFIGSGIPGMLNMTGVSQSIQKGLPAGRKYAFGAALPFILHAGIALVFTNYLTQHPELFDLIRQVSVFLFLLLAVLFFWQAKYPKPIKTHSRRGAMFLIGFTLGCANALVIPYFFAVSSWLINKGWMDLSQAHIISFVSGSFLGALVIFLLYVHGAQIINKRAAWFTRNLNYVLAGLFAFLAVLQIGQLMF